MLKVFLTDDDEDDRSFFEEAINALDMQVDLKLFHNGAALMDYLNQSQYDLLPQLIFLDLNMPIKNGMECLREIKSSEKLKHIVVAIYSTSSSELDIEKTFIAGANIYINKPNNYKTLQNVIAKVLKINWQYHNSNFNRSTFLLRV